MGSNQIEKKITPYSQVVGSLSVLVAPKSPSTNPFTFKPFF